MTEFFEGLFLPLPRDRTITSLSAYFSNDIALALVGSTVTLQAQLYASSTPDDTFTPVPGAVVTLAPALAGVIGVGPAGDGTTTGLEEGSSFSHL